MSDATATLETKTIPNPEEPTSTDVGVDTLPGEEPVKTEPDAKTEPDVKPDPDAKTEPDVKPVPKPVEKKNEDELHDSRRIKKYITRAFEAEAQADALRKQIAATAPIQQVKVPQRTEFGSDAEYYNAINLYNMNVMRTEFDSKINEQKARENQRELEIKTEQARKEYEDFDDVLAESTVGFTPQIQQAIVESDVSADMMYALAKDETLATKIARLPSHLAIKELGKLEAKIEAEKSSKKTPTAVAKPVSKAPAPIKPVASKSDVGAVDPSKLSDAEWLAWRRRQKYKLK